MTDFENAAFSVFIVLLSRAIMSRNINFYIPISKVTSRPSQSLRARATKLTWSRRKQVDENMRRAQQRDALNDAKFYFRREIFTPTSSRATSGAATPEVTPSSDPCSVVSSLQQLTNGFGNGHHNGRRKQRVMENCFPPPPLPDEGLVGGNVNEEYGEYTLDEIINGKVREEHINKLIRSSSSASLLRAG